ncbi:hypothetical protein [Streptomyces sp. NPDC001985]|uniref:hypothetical protein n=1 Tax=Streptomyces sp. NPDC001985 TaxID=3154406 RepID=UPI00332545D4
MAVYDFTGPGATAAIAATQAEINTFNAGHRVRASSVSGDGVPTFKGRPAGGRALVAVTPRTPAPGARTATRASEVTPRAPGRDAANLRAGGAEAGSGGLLNRAAGGTAGPGANGGPQNRAAGVTDPTTRLSSTATPPPGTGAAALSTGTGIGIGTGALEKQAGQGLGALTAPAGGPPATGSVGRPGGPAPGSATPRTPSSFDFGGGTGRVNALAGSGESGLSTTRTSAAGNGSGAGDGSRTPRIDGSGVGRLAGTADFTGTGRAGTPDGGGERRPATGRIGTPDLSGAGLNLPGGSGGDGRTKLSSLSADGLGSAGTGSGGGGAAGGAGTGGVGSLSAGSLGKVGGPGSPGGGAASLLSGGGSGVLGAGTAPAGPALDTATGIRPAPGQAGAAGGPGGAAPGGAPMMPMGGMGGGMGGAAPQNPQEKESAADAWLTEDEDIWGGGDCAPGRLGRD